MQSTFRNPTILPRTQWGGGRKGGWASTCQRPSALKHGSDRHETLPKRVSDDPRQVNFRPKKFFSPRFFGLENRFTRFWSNFGGPTGKRTSPANSSQFFALDALNMSSVRPNIVQNMCVGASEPATRQPYPPLNSTPPFDLPYYCSVTPPQKN